MAWIPEKDQTVLRFRWDSIRNNAEKSEVVFKAIVDDFFARVWDKKQLAMLTIPFTECFPLSMETALDMWADERMQIVRIERELNSRMYKLLNQREDS